MSAVTEDESVADVVDSRSEIARAPTTDTPPDVVVAAEAYNGSNRYVDASLSIAGSCAPPSAATATMPTSDVLAAESVRLPVETSAASAISAVVMPRTTLTPTLAPNGAVRGVAFAVEMISLDASSSRALATVRSTLPPMREMAVLLTFDTATAASALAFAGA